MDLNTLDIGLMIWQMVEEDYFMQMVMFIKGNGWMTKQMELGNIIMLMELNFQEIGLMMCRMEMEYKLGLMVPDTKDST